MGAGDKKHAPPQSPALRDDEGARGAGDAFTESADILGESRFIPMDVADLETEYFIEVDLPGVAVDSVNVSVQDQWLVIEGVKRAINEDTGEKVNFLCLERAFGPFRRTLKIPTAVDSDGVAAFYHHGVLTIRLPKLADRRRRVRRGPIQEGKIQDLP